MSQLHGSFLGLPPLIPSHPAKQMRWPQDRDGHTDEMNSDGCPGGLQAERILNSWESIEVRWWWAMAEKGAWNHICTRASQDLNCALINMQIELLSRWVPFSFQHTELEVTKKKKWVLVNVLCKQCSCGCLQF